MERSIWYFKRWSGVFDLEYADDIVLLSDDAWAI